MPRKLKVVVAHHERVVADTLAKILEFHSVSTAVAYSSVAALDLVLSTNPDLAILCIVPANVDDVNGVYAAVVVRTLMPACRIVLIPGGSGGWVIDPLTLAQARGYEFELMVEPVHPENLLEVLAQLHGEDTEPIRRVSVPMSVEARVATAPQDSTSSLIGRKPKGWFAARNFFKKRTRSN